MAAAFEGYEKQYCELSAHLAKRCSSASLLDGEQKKQKIFEINTGIDQAEALIRKMDIEARGLQPNIKAVLLAKLREYKSDLNNLKSNVKRIASSNLNQAARDELLEAGMADTLSVSANQRDRLLMSTERLNKSSNRIHESRKVMLETEELGVSLLQDLHQQRQGVFSEKLWLLLSGVMVFFLSLSFELGYGGSRGDRTDEELAQRLKSSSLSEKENALVDIEQEDIKLSASHWSLCRKIVGERKAS
ncbi:vesicle transport v-SNARE family protein [Striga asiatica]|uniref:Vesicle transport v-SNARE family protein n=1 Tax=Striga asiatica TaxID=4170 RepID=A0A5A7PZ59_STRAF|nr:vesicle transport v-SNARE family protein [Striga asiatica]